MTSPTPAPAQHVYAIADRYDGDWGAYCLACSQAAGDYTYPCKVGVQPTPPPVLVAR